MYLESDSTTNSFEDGTENWQKLANYFSAVLVAPANSKQERGYTLSHKVISYRELKYVK